MRRLMLPLLVLVALVALCLPGLSAQDEVGPSILQLVDTEPFQGEELGLQEPITVYFDRAINCDSAPNAVTITPAVQGGLVCGDSQTSLIFTPTEAYARDTEYTLEIGAALTGQDDSQLLEPATLKFKTVGFLQVSEVFPADGTLDIESDAVITVIFNRPVVPLVTVEEMDTLPQPLTISPAIEGTGEWLNTSIYLFRPTEAFAGGTQYTVTVNAGLEAVDGSVLQEPFQWSFRTIFPEITNLSPRSEDGAVSLEPLIQVRFNQAMDRESVEANFYLKDDDGRTYAGEFSWADDNAGFSFTPTERLELDTLYIAGFNSGKVYEQTRHATLTGVIEWNFATVPLPAIVSTSPRNGDESVPPYGGFTIYFASPMDQDTFEDKITISPEPRIEPSLYYYDYGDSLSVSFPPEPSTTYTITIAPGMADPYGNTIDTPFTFTYSTGGYDPDLMMQVPGPVGFYNAFREKTQLFITHLNVSRVDLELYSVPLQGFVQRVTSEDYYYDPAYDYNPSATDLLRRWTIPSVAPENVMRYELLSLGGESADCPSSPPARVKVGDTAIVITEPDPVRARETPPDGEIVDLLYRGYSLTIVGGPTCANDIRWWEVELRDQRRAWVAEGIGEEYLIDVRVSADVTQVEVNDSLGGKLPPGVYFLRISSPETGNRGYRPSRHMLVVSTANLAVKYSIDSITVWATNVQTGEPIANAPLTVYGAEFQVLGQGTTDAGGIARIDIPRVPDLFVPRAVVLQSGDQFGLSLTDWTDGIEPWQFGHSYNFYPQQYRVYMYTDRPLYRPGQPVYFKGIARLKDDVMYTPANLDTVPVKIYNDQGEIIYEKNLQLTPFGSFSDTFTLDENAGLGYYSVSVELPSEHEYQSEGGSIGFTVGEYRVPEFQVTATPVENEVVQGSTVEVTVDSTYFFGGPVSNARVEYNVISEPYFFDFTGKGYYDFIDYNYDSGPGEFFGSSSGLVASGSGITDSRGMFTVEVPASLEDATQSQRFTIEATVSDESQQAISGRTNVIVHQGLVYIGARPTKWVNVAGQETSFDIVAVDWDSNPVANQSVDIEVVERRWSSTQEEDEFGHVTWTWEVEEIPVTEGDVQTDSEGLAQFVFTPPKGGIFKLIITTRDANGNEIRASTTTWVSSREYVSWRQQNSNRIDLIAGQTEFTVGETAEILIASPFQGTAEAWITVERGDVMHSERVTMDSNSYIYRLPITPEMAPNVFVSALIIKGVDENNPVAAFRMGSIQLSVDTAQKVLNVEVTPDRERAGPRETVTYTVHTTDYEGDPVEAEVGVGLTDLAVLSIIGPNSGPLLPFFYGEEGLGIRTATPLTINTDQLTQTTLDTIKGGGGGLGAFGITEIRENFIDTPYWNATLVTDANGEATFEVTLPDQLTTWRLDARAIGNGENGVMLVGQNTVDLLSTKPVLIRPVTPRFFVVGDNLILAAVVNNNSGEALSVDVALQATGITIDGDSSQTVIIENNERARITWNVTVEDVADVDLTFFASANDGKFTDASKPPVGQPPDRLIPVYKYEVPETVGTAGILRQVGSRTEAIILPRRFDVTQGELTINLQPSLAATTIDSLDYLRNYPYQCTEQTVSRFLPNIMTFRALDSLGVENEDLEASLNVEVQFAIQRLYATQHVDGGWGWFVQERSSPTTSAYALIGLIEARNAGFVVDGGVIQRAQGFLRTTFIVPSLSEPRWRLNRQAFILYALARSGDPDIARSVTLFEERERLSLYSRAFLALTFSMITPNDASRSDVLISDLINAAAVSATGVHWSEDYSDWWNWNTDTRTTAIALDALVKLRPNSDLIPNVVRYLMVQRKADAWETTQETAWAVMSLTDWMLVSGELKPDYQFNASLNGEELVETSAKPENVRDTQKLVIEVGDMLKDQANMLEVARTEGPGVLYYTAHLRAFLPVPEIEPLNRGIIIERRYTLLNDDSNEPITEARIGDVVQVRLTIIAPNSLHYVVIEDPLPAGAEGIDPKLNISQQIGTRPTLDRTNPLSRGWGWWYFSNIEFRDEKVVFFSSFLPAGTYEYVYTMRPGLEGTYNVIPPVGYEFYFPEVYGRGAGSTFTVLPLE